MAIVLTVIVLSMTIHEAMHAFIGYFLGDVTAKSEGRLTINPLKHIDPFMTILLPITMLIIGGPIFGGARPVPFNPQRVRHGDWGVVLVALAGPITNLLLAFLAFGVGVMSGIIMEHGAIEASLLGDIVSTTVFVNLGFFVFNMLPIPPLDGSRLLYALAPEFVQKAMVQVERYGVTGVFILVVVFSGVVSQVMTTCMRAILDVFIMIFRV